MTTITYEAHPTARLLHASKKPVRGFLGPVGNGKSVACIQEALRLSLDQHPNKDGIRKSRGVIIRNTGPELRTTTLKTWKQWLPENVCPVVMHPVITARMQQPLSDGTRIDMEVLFLALDNDQDVKKLLSLECSWAFINEARELPFSVLKACRERVGRYPGRIDGYGDIGTYKGPRDEDGNLQPCKHPSVIMDTNPPDDDHWWYQLAEEGCLRTSRNPDFDRREVERVFDFFRGPPALLKIADGYVPNPDAENIDNLPGGHKYYMDMLAGNTQEHVNVMILGNYGALYDGKPVYAVYNDVIHCPKKGVRAARGLPIGIAWDFGMTPACVIGQMTSSGQLKVIAEIVTDDNNVRDFARDEVKPFLQRHFSDFEIAFSVGDPSGNARGEGEGKSAIGILNDEYDTEEPLNLGFVTEPAKTNDPTRRIDAVNQFLLKMVAGGEPGYLLNHMCKTLRKGKQGAYAYRKVRSGEKWREKPDKNAYSHAADAEQYLALEFLGNFDKEEEMDEEPLNARQFAAGGY